MFAIYCLNSSKTVLKSSSSILYSRAVWLSGTGGDTLHNTHSNGIQHLSSRWGQQYLPPCCFMKDTRQSRFDSEHSMIVPIYQLPSYMHAIKHPGCSLTSDLDRTCWPVHHRQMNGYIIYILLPKVQERLQYITW